MKYFINFPYTAESLKNEYREFCKKLHPDTGGNKEAFQEMQNEYEQTARNLNGTRQHAEAERARQEAEARRREREEEEREAREYEARERARREQEEAEERERIRKAQEESRAAVRAWAGILERVAADATGQKARFNRFDNKKEAAAFMATTKRNVKAVINHYFPGLKVAVKISGEIWKEKFVITWEDGPSEKQLRDTCKELEFFLPACYHCAGPYEDYGHYEEDHSTAPWREAYGQALGDIDDFETVRTLSDEGKQEAEALAARILSGWNNVEGGRIRVTLSEFCNLREALGFDRLNDRRMYWTNYANNDRREDGEDVADMYRDTLRRVIYENATITVTEQEKAERRAAEFHPRYGEALRKLRELTGVGNTDKDGDAVCFFTTDRNSDRRRLTIAEAVKQLEQGEAVAFGIEHKGEDGRAWYWGKFAGGYKTQDKRAEKFAAAGLTIRGHVSPHSFISLHGIAPEFAAAIRADLEDIERQRREWEAKQNGTQKPANEPTANKLTESKQESRETVTANESNGDGLTMEKYSEKATVIRGYNEQQAAELEAMGGKEWRNLKGGKGYIFSTRRHGDELAEWMKQQAGEGTTVPAADEPQAEQETDTLETAQDITESESEPEAADLSPVLQAFADFFGTLFDIMQQAKQWEGVTVPAATLARWKQEATEGTKTAAARLCEVCACLASLTPDSRRDFDALGAIFWSLSEQIRNGYNPDTLQAATDYARAQLFDLIDRTQTENQARAVREANGEDNEQRKAA